MDDILDQPFVQPDRTNVKYGGFWQRFGALIVDGIIFAPFTIGVSFLSTSWQTSMLAILISVVGLAYKPYMEYAYGATWGKMLLKLKVTNNNFENASLGAILLRNIFYIIPDLIALVFSIMTFSDPEFQSVGWTKLGGFTDSFGYMQIVNQLTGLFAIVDAIVLGVDPQKRSIHDRIAGTLVLDES